jgi:hypothetical protein
VVATKAASRSVRQKTAESEASVDKSLYGDFMHFF